MRTTFKPIAAVMTAFSAASFALAACTAETADPAADAGETAAAPADNDALTGAEIEQAVPGIEDADPEGETGVTADLGEEENVEYTDDADSDREAETARD
ncbi:hypothetical protein [Erythrobacter rubeus]|uniref:Secreted protein n=1 Tax=Erythrobacter rubeus TaxID=2760803 RepID=A0ABR8KQG6_9SPHN|nr:hypothetical protein [Erythrobacter rubeus]MBD2842935.1 hypothetical protein [Erythrobacter rubeus]